MQKRDRYGRLLAYVLEPVRKTSEVEVKGGILKEGDMKPIAIVDRVDPHLESDIIFVNLNAYLVQIGYASPLTVPPNVKYAQIFRALYEKAREKNRGLWRIENLKRKHEK